MLRLPTISRHDLRAILGASEQDFLLLHRRQRVSAEPPVGRASQTIHHPTGQPRAGQLPFSTARKQVPNVDDELLAQERAVVRPQRIFDQALADMTQPAAVAWMRQFEFGFDHAGLLFKFRADFRRKYRSQMEFFVVR